MAAKVLVIGSGGREHALAWKLSQSESVKNVYVAPGNAGTLGKAGDGKISNVDVNVKNFSDVAAWCKQNEISLVIVGPEDPLAEGISNYLKGLGIKCFGPCRKPAQIEASKEFAKSFMDRHGIPTAQWKSFDDADAAKNHILKAPYKALVVKASGLAAGKGVIVANTRDEAAQAVDALKQDEGLSAASKTIIIEELLEGEEISVLCFSDGTNISVMPPAQDHKRLLEGDNGPNTGGMGAYCKCPQATDETLRFIKKNVLQKVVDGMKRDGMPYVGVLYAGLMMTSNGPKVLEFNCRFGDPETQVILPLLKSDLYQIMLACVDGKLKAIKVQWSQDKYAVGVVVVSGGYPASYPKGKVISGLEKLKEPKYIVFHAGTATQSNNVVTSGGRVLAVVSVENDLNTAASEAQKGASIINFEGAFYRKDIAYRALQRHTQEGMTYKASGVDIESADDLVNKIKILTKSTLRSGVCGGIGGFGGIFDLEAAGFKDPYLVSIGKDIGEKLKIAQECGKHDSIGYDLVATCINDVICHGAEPLFFLDTFTCGKLDVNVGHDVISGITKGCKEAKCALIGGETAEMPGMYSDGDYDLSGFARGAVEKHNFRPPSDSSFNDGDIILGLPSSGLHCGDFHFVRKLVEKQELKYTDISPFDSNRTLGESLLTPSKIYSKSILSVSKLINAIVHTADTGLNKNLVRILPDHLAAVLDFDQWDVPAVFSWIATSGNISPDDMHNRFNCGVGMMMIVSKQNVKEVTKLLKGEGCQVIGQVIAKSENQKKFEVLNWKAASVKKPVKKRVGVLISGSGTNLQSLIDYTMNPNNMSSAEIVVVLSNIDGVEGLEKAKKAGIATEVLSHKGFKRIDFDREVTTILRDHRVEIICLAGFMRILSEEFVQTWQGKILNVHPSILPAFKGMDAHKQVLEIGARITGCTVHFVEPDVDAGAIIEQAATIVKVGDTEKSLQERVKTLEHVIFPKALELLASGKVCRGEDSKLIWLKEDNTKNCVPVVPFNEDLDAKIKSLMKSTSRPGSSADSKWDCGIFDPKKSGYIDPYLVSGTDGVGTKLKIAQECNKHDTIGIDLVAMCVNDILTHGAEPLFFLQCFVSGKLNPATTIDVISGVAEGCRQANCSLIGAEVAQIPDTYTGNGNMLSFNNYDVVGYAEGALDKRHLLPRTNEIKDDDILIGIPSSGIHSNGYSLVRRLVEVKNLRYQDPAPFDNTRTLGEALLTPTKIYVKSVLPLMKKGFVKAAAHITGGGLTENIPRVLPKDCGVVLDAAKWNVPAVLKWIESEGRMSEKEMQKTFNCGLGMVLIVRKEYSELGLKDLKDAGENATVIGNVRSIREGEQQVRIENWHHSYKEAKSQKRVAVLISGSGTNLQALIDYTQNPANQSSAKIALVLSNKPNVEGLRRAEKANISTKVLSHTGFKNRVEFDMAVHAELKANNIDIVCLAGFMRILSKEFVQLWQGKLLNVHPALLPAFKGMDAHKQVLELGARITGCTVHFVEPEVDAGAIIEQAAVKVGYKDTVEQLQDRVKILEHQLFPKALELLASERISRDADGKLKWHF